MKILVVGLGYVGVPVAASLANAGHTVVGVDIDPGRVETLNGGNSPFPTREPGLEAMIADVVAKGRLKATESLEASEDVDAIIVAVDTPVDPATHEPDFSALRSALETVTIHMRKGVLVSVESTLVPGTMRNLVCPLLEERSGLRVHEDFHLVHCPERVTAGRLLQNLTTLDRAIGGEDEESRRRAIELYGDICTGRLHETDWLHAELSKTVENAYRDVELAFANEVALICEHAGADVLEVRQLVNTCPGRSMLMPGPGVGGHCIPKDTWLLASSVGDEARLMLAAREVNDGMLDHVTRLVTQAVGGEGLKGARILLLGGAYKENVAETKNSPGVRLHRDLESLGATVRLHDPHVVAIEGVDLWQDLEEAAEGADCVVLVTAHDDYREIDWEALATRMNRRALVDCRGVAPREALEGRGYRFFGLGRPGSA